MRRTVLAALMMLAASGAQAQGSASSGPIVRPVITVLVRAPGPLPPAPPWQDEDPKGVITFLDPSSDLYSCARGSAVHWASELRAFETQYRAPRINEGEKYVAARELDIPLPARPPVMDPATVLLRVAVGEDGKVRDAIVACSSDDRQTDAVLAVVKEAAFAPASSHGVSVSSIETVEYVFLRF